MPNRTFFLDEESNQSIRSKRLPIRSRSDDATTSSRQRPRIQSQPPSEQEASRRRYARQLATTEKDRVRRRRAYRKRSQSAGPHQDFEAVFESPSGSDLPADVTKAATELQSSLKHVLPPWPTALSPMERFVALSPDEDQWCIDSRSKWRKYGPRLGDQESARDRMRLAIQLAADTTLLRQRAALLGTADSTVEHMVASNETSWLNLEEDSVMSCTGGSCSAEIDDGRKTASKVSL